MDNAYDPTLQNNIRANQALAKAEREKDAFTELLHKYNALVHEYNKVNKRNVELLQEKHLREAKEKNEKRTKKN